MERYDYRPSFDMDQYEITAERGTDEFEEILDILSTLKNAGIVNDIGYSEKIFNVKADKEIQDSFPDYLWKYISQYD